jgi:hypothetical protein
MLRSVESFSCLLRYSQKKSRVFADFADAYGAGFLGKLTYPQFVGLWLNRNRVLYRRAQSVVLGVALANRADPPKDFFAEITDNEQEEAVAASRHRAAQRQANG